MTKQQRIHVGKVIGVHGVKGLVTVKIFSDDLNSLLNQGDVTDKQGERVFKLHFHFKKKQGFVFSVDGIIDRTIAEQLRGTDFYVSDANLSETDDDEFYHKDLVGCQIIDQDGSTIGTVVSLQNYGAGDLLEFQMGENKGETAFIPFNNSFIQEVDLKNQQIKATIPDGLLDL